MSSPWFFLILAGLLEAFWAVGLKLSEGFTRPFSSIVTILLMLASFYFLSRSMRELPLGIAYPVWVGLGSAGTVLMGSVFFQEELSWPKIICLLGLLISVAGLKLAESAS